MRARPDGICKVTKTRWPSAEIGKDAYHPEAATASQGGLLFFKPRLAEFEDYDVGELDLVKDCSLVFNGVDFGLREGFLAAGTGEVDGDRGGKLERKAKVLVPLLARDGSEVDGR